MSVFLENISKSFNFVSALKNINLRVEKGKNTVLIGPSGCGKSTLIRISIGLINPDSGSVFIENEKLTDENVLDLRKKTGYVIQDGGLFPHLTAEGNVKLMSEYSGMKKEVIEKRIKELAGLTKFPVNGLKRFPAELSGGQKQRVSLMRALMQDPDILLLDEPLGALDPLIRYDLQTDLKEIFRELNKTVIMVTHDMSEAAFFGDKIVLMREGEIIQEGEPDSLLNNPADLFVEKFIKAQRSYLRFNS